jgi:hypothetical protein
MMRYVPDIKLTFCFIDGQEDVVHFCCAVHRVRCLLSKDRGICQWLRLSLIPQRLRYSMSLFVIRYHVDNVIGTDTAFDHLHSERQPRVHLAIGSLVGRQHSGSQHREIHGGRVGRWNELTSASSSLA